jgi:predicted O-linked N-acetylglucosamine transferase (SPINDLY family)
VLTQLPSLPSSTFDRIFYKLPNLDTEFSRAVESVASEVHVLKQHDTIESQDIIKSTSPDILLFMALGMSPVTYYISMSRLSPVTAVFGHGHPITSGLTSVDYFITSDLFEYNDSNYRMLPDDDRPEPRMASSGYHDYTEQLIKFDTLTTHFIPPNVDTVVDVTAVELSSDSNYYACLQYTKKIHPLFDDVILGILLSDENGIILMLSGANRFIPRWKDKGFTDDMLSRIKYVPRMPRDELMSLLDLCAAMLGTFPWGDGVTTFEALSRGLPVVVLPQAITVEQLSLGQIRTIGMEDVMVAASVEEYVEKAVRLGRDKVFREHVGELLLERRELLFGERQLKAVVEEWAAFFERVASN